MQPYFSGYITHFATAKGYRHRLQYYFFVRPAVQWWSFNALLQGGLFSGRSSYYAGVDSKGQSPALKKVTATVCGRRTGIWQRKPLIDPERADSVDPRCLQPDGGEYIPYL